MTRMKKGPPPADPTTKKCPECLSEIPIPRAALRLLHVAGLAALPEKPSRHGNQPIDTPVINTPTDKDRRPPKPPAGKRKTTLFFRLLSGSMVLRIEHRQSGQT